MLKQRILRILAVMMVLNILIIPLTSFLPQEQNKYTVHASGELVDIRFFNAFLVAIGITAFGVGNMSQNFSIPEVDMVALKDQFQATLDADATKKAAWMNAQADYLSGGVAKTMGAAELAKIGINDVYNEFKSYLFTNVDNPTNYNPDGTTINTNRGSFTMSTTLYDVTQYISCPRSGWSGYGYQGVISSSTEHIYIDAHDTYVISYFVNGVLSEELAFVRGPYNYYIIIRDSNPYVPPNSGILQSITSICSSYGIDVKMRWPALSPSGYSGTITKPNILNSTDTSISIIPSIPYVDSSFAIGTIVTPAIVEPYAGAVPIDVPISVPIDPTDPIDPPAEEDKTLLGTVAAILAGITPISGLLDNILDSELDIADVISVGLTNVIDGIGDITGTLTGGITAGITSVVTGITDLTNSLTDTVADQTVNLDPIKNIPSVIFTKFPFCIPWDFAKIITFMNDSAREPPDINLVIPFSNSLSFLGIGDFTFDLDFSMFDTPASFIRMAELIVFSLLVMFKTKTLIWG